MSIVKSPENKLGRDWVVDSMAKVKNALQWLGFIKSESDRVNALIAAEVRAINDKYAAELEISGQGRKRVTHADLKKSLEKQLTKFCTKKRKQLLEDCGSKKTRGFDGAGSLSFKVQPAQVDNVDSNQSPADCLTQFAEAVGLTNALHNWVARQVVWKDEAGTLYLSPASRLSLDQQEHEPDEEFGTVKLSLLMSCKAAFDKSAIKNNRKADLISDEQLKAIGLKLHTPDEKLLIKPAKWNVQSESEATHAA